MSHLSPSKKLHYIVLIKYRFLVFNTDLYKTNIKIAASFLKFFVALIIFVILTPLYQSNGTQKQFDFPNGKKIKH